MSDTQTISTTKRERALAVNRASFNEEKRTVDVIFATETPCPSWCWEMGGRYEEILDCNAKSFDGVRFKSGGQFLKEHDRDKVVGVIEDYRFEGNQGIATLRYAKTLLGEEEFGLMRDKIRNNFSVSYYIKELQFDSEKDGVKTCRATSWEGLEISVVSVPADPNCTALRSEGAPTHETKIKNMNPTPEPAKLNEAEVRAAERASILKNANEVKASAASMRSSGRNIDTLEQQALNEFWTADQFRAAAEKLPVITEADKQKIREEVRASILETNKEIDGVVARYKSLGKDFTSIADKAKAEGKTGAEFRSLCDAEIDKLAKDAPKVDSQGNNQPKTDAKGIDKARSFIKLPGVSKAA